MNEHTRITPAILGSPVLSSAALGDLSPEMQACYENVHAKLQRNEALLPSELVALEERLDELWDDAAEALERAPHNFNGAIFAALGSAKRLKRPVLGVAASRQLLKWALVAEETRGDPRMGVDTLELAVRLLVDPEARDGVR